MAALGRHSAAQRFPGNVHNVVVKTALEGKPGDLVFDACFESGNLGNVLQVEPFEYDLVVRPDTNNPRHHLWFYFKVSNAFHGQRVVFNIVNLSKTKSLYRDGMSPLVRSTSRPEWERIPKQNVFYYKAPHTKKQYILSFAFVFDNEDDEFFFAYCYPYTYTQLQTYLKKLTLKRHAYFQCDVLASSAQRRRLDLLTITSPDNIKALTNRTGIGERCRENLRMVFITARVHPGETSASFVCEGLIDFLVSQHPLAQELRRKIIFKIIPMLNPDGVYLGNYRCGTAGFDLNRSWHKPDRINHPTIVATKDLLQRYIQQPGLHLDFFMDIHGHTTLPNAFMYGNEYDDRARMKAQWVFPQMLSRRAVDFSLNQTLFNCDKQKAGTGRRSLGGIVDSQAQCYTLEVSLYGYCASALPYITPYTTARYKLLGKRVGEAFADFYA